MADPNNPTVPNTAGVPNVNRPQDHVDTGPEIVVTAKTQDGPSVNKTSKVKWGIFDSSGKLVLAPDSFVDLDQSKEWRIPTYPLEGGSFQSFNKVEVPGEVQVTLAKGGTLADRAAFLNTVKKVAKSLDIYTVITPEETYKNVNITRRGIQRSATMGASLIVVTLGLSEVRIGAAAAFSNVQNPASAPSASNGGVQSATPTAAQTPSGAPQ